MALTAVDLKKMARSWSGRALCAAVAFYLMLTVASRLWVNQSLSFSFSLATTVIQTTLDLVAIRLLLLNDQHRLESLRLRRVLIIGFASAAFADFIYGIAINVIGVSDTRGTWLELAYNVPFNAFLVCSGLFFLTVIHRVAKSWLLVTILLTVVAGVLGMSYVATVALGALPVQTLLLTTCSWIAQAAILIGATVFFFFGTNLSTQLIGCGFLTICSVNLLLQCLEFAGQLQPGIPFEAFWAFGQSLVCLGLARSAQEQSGDRFALLWGLKNQRARILLGMVVLLVIAQGVWFVFFWSTRSIYKSNPWMVLFLTVISISILLSLLSAIFRRLAIVPLIQVLESIEKPRDVYPTLLPVDEELAALGGRVFAGIAEKERAGRAAALGKLAVQVAHDIRSPLTAIENALGGLEALPEDDRILMRGAANRIKDIANNLIEKNREMYLGKSIGGSSSSNETPATYLLSSITESLVTEKRMQYRARREIEIDVDLAPSAYGLFAIVQLSAYKRVLSNLINNSVEALNDRGKILLKLAEKDGQVEIRVQDDGRGIPPEILAKIGQRGETYGKASGTGLGLHHARAAVEGWGGKLGIWSEIGRGTEVTVTLPQAPAPAWFVSELKLIPNSAAVILDDDVGIHHVWQGRFDALDVRKRRIQVHHFSTPGELRGWVKNNMEAARTALFLSDQELLGHRETGLDLIEELGIGKRAILVTSHYEEKSLLETCQRLGVRLIPKVSVGRVPIRVLDGEKVDAILIDDDPLVQMNWRIAAKRTGRTCLGFTDPAEFLSTAEGIDKSVPVYIDSLLGRDGNGNELKGEEIAKGIRSLGFQRIYLATGLPPQGAEKMTWLTGIRDKEAPFADVDEMGQDLPLSTFAGKAGGLRTACRVSQNATGNGCG